VKFLNSKIQVKKTSRIMKCFGLMLVVAVCLASSVSAARLESLEKYYQQLRLGRFTVLGDRSETKYKH
jgi:hypothetical protein